MTTVSCHRPSKVITCRRQCYPTQSRFPHCSQVCRRGVKVLVCSAWGRGVRRAIALLLLSEKSQLHHLSLHPLSSEVCHSAEKKFCVFPRFHHSSHLPLTIKTENFIEFLY